MFFAAISMTLLACLPPPRSFDGIALGETVPSIIAMEGVAKPVKAGNMTIYAWPQPHGSVLRVGFINNGVSVVDFVAGVDDQSSPTMPPPLSGPLTFNASGHINAENIAAHPPDIFRDDAARPQSRTLAHLDVFVDGDRAVALFFDEPADGVLREVLYGYPDALSAYGIPLRRK